MSGTLNAGLFSLGGRMDRLASSRRDSLPRLRNRNRKRNRLVERSLRLEMQTSQLGKCNVIALPPVLLLSSRYTPRVGQREEDKMGFLEQVGALLGARFLVSCHRISHRGYQETAYIYVRASIATI